MPSSIRRVALAATAATIAVIAPAAALGADYLYYSGTGGGGFIGRVNQDGTGNNQSFITPMVSGAGNIAASSTSLFWSRPANFVGHSALDGSDVNFNWLDATGPLSPAVAVNSRYVFFAWGAGGGAGTQYIGRANLDGTGSTPTWVALPGMAGAWWLAADESYVYWLDGGTATSIGRMAMDGTGANATFITGLTNARSIAVTPTNIYWTDDVGATTSIGRANLDGTGVNTSLITGLTDGVRSITVSNGKIFWATFTGGNSTISSANVDGTGVNASFLTGLPPSIYGVTTQYAGGSSALTVTRSGAGAGTVSSSPAGIDCGSTCTAQFTAGTSVTLTAAAAPGSNFTGWGGACAGSATTCTVSMTEARSVNAEFSQAPITVLFARAGKAGPGIVRVSVPSAGRLAMTGTRGAAKATVCRAVANPTAAGKVTLRCTPNSATAALLRTRSVKVALALTFTPTGGTAVRTTGSLTFRKRGGAQHRTVVTG